MTPITPPPRWLNALVWGTLGVVILAVIWVSAVRQSKLASSPALPILGQVGDFSLTNQFGRPLSPKDLVGRVWLANIIFTRCPGPCLSMTRFMHALSRQLQDAANVGLLSLTTDPGFDTPEVLQAYWRKHTAATTNWVFLTGPAKEIATLAIKGLKLTSLGKGESERQSPDDLFIHSTVTVLVDRQGRLRASFETVGEGVDPTKSMESIRKAVERLNAERN